MPFTRHPQNPIFGPDEDQPWEALATFNGSITPNDKGYHFLYRAQGEVKRYFDQDISLASIGYAQSPDGVNFKNRRLFIHPEDPWEQFGAEDPRVTKLGKYYYIFYTALSAFPPQPQDIKIGVALTCDFKKIEQKHQATHFNSKAMALFPEKINGKIMALLAVHTDRPPAKICLVSFGNEEEIWFRPFWEKWYASWEKNALSLSCGEKDHLELGSAPLKTPKGWLIFYSYIENYFAGRPKFTIRAALLDLKNPQKVLAQSDSLLEPREEYERFGQVPGVIFPSGATLKNNQVYLYYGAADTTCCLATAPLGETLKELLLPKKITIIDQSREFRLKQYPKNPILTPKQEHPWESRYVLNPGAIFAGNRVHLLYRAMGEDYTSVLGYASSKDGFNFDKRLDLPVYTPRADFELKAEPNIYSGCEDPRLTLLNDQLYLCYTGFDGKTPTTAALSSIKIDDFLARRWQWTFPQRLSYPGRSDKNVALLPEKIKDQYVFFHRVGHCIWVDRVDRLECFGKICWLGGQVIMWPRAGKWDSEKIGIAGVPRETPDGWILIYHGLSREDRQYRLGAVLLDRKNPEKVLRHLDYPILEPQEPYEKQGLRPGTVFSCGSMVLDNQLLVYYGAADQVIAVASGSFKKLLQALKNAPSGE